MFRFTLSDDDAQRYGVSQLDYDINNPRLKEIRELGRQCGLKWNELQDRLPDGPQDERPADVEAAGIVFWLAALRAGVDVRWDDFDLDMYGVRVEEIPDPNLPAPDGASTSSKRTSRRSRTSSA